MDDKMIELDSVQGKFWGFTSDKFGPGSYLWKKDQAIYISFIESLEKGNFKALIEMLIECGYDIKIPTPMGAMRNIVIQNNYKPTIELDDKIGPVEVWTLKNPKAEK